MNKFIIILMLLSIGNGVYAQNKTDALRDAKITSEATLKMDFKTVLKHTHPNIVKLMGGEEKAITFLKSTFDSMTSQGFVFEKADVVSVSDIVQEQGEYRCIIEGYNQMTMSGMRIKSKSYLLGFYDDVKKIWYYLEAKQLKNEAMLSQVLPSFETTLNIPDDETTTEPLKK